MAIDDGVLAQVEFAVRDMRSDNFGNPYDSVDDLPLSPAQKECVLEWYAKKVCHTANPDECCCGKSYDPLTIEGHTAHSYAFDFKDGGRHHPFGSLAELEGWLDDELRLLFRCAGGGV